MGESNFQFLQQRWPLLTTLGKAAERNLHHDPNTTLYKVRLFGETMAKFIYEEEGLGQPRPHTQYERLRTLRREGDVPQEVIGMLHSIREKGNPAVHDAVGTYEEGQIVLKTSHKLAVWLMQTYGERQYEPAEYREPTPMPEPEEIRQQLEAEFQREQERLEQKFEKELERIRAESRNQAAILERRKQARVAAKRLQLSEEETRRLIDKQLEQAGWEVNSRNLRYAHGARPEKGKNRAIAEWPTTTGKADYALFVGLRLVGFVEAKSIDEDISSHLEQAKRYAQSIEKIEGEEILGP